jgi:hypothetical protein
MVDGAVLVVVDAPCPVTLGDMNRRVMDSSAMRRIGGILFIEAKSY